MANKKHEPRVAQQKAPPRGSGYSWSPERQEIFHKRKVYAHEGLTNTPPSHDLAHLIVAMSSNLHWLPQGQTDRIRLAEYNAVLLEHLLANSYDCIVMRTISADRVLPKTLAHARWFVEVHYAPFPVAAEEAYRQFCQGIHPAAASRLSGYYFQQVRREQRTGFRKRPWNLQINAQSTPRPSRLALKFQNFVKGKLEEMTAVQSRTRRITLKKWASHPPNNR